ncbi:siphovirus ReqiPepy6 Gp37-like family protein [Alkalihalobacillus sp. BA299]|uniref:siphovirus ReqiPepy6 Gp37-like family protein n=1 Tax=Alkalihalobacillus sp. BA299 TaxID=2815938 RepID=UPI001ADBBA4A|nr:siphovirus ReqiPepy6 Gp37-like family protein [Alkalihalobacillus sp. BA299]
MGYEIYVRNVNLKRIAPVEDYQSLELVMRFNAAGSWTLTIPTDSKAAKELIKPKAGIIVKKDGQMIFSGPVKSRNRKWDIDEDTVTISGRDDLIHLQNLALPVPGGPPYTSAYDVRTGVAETVIREYIDYNIGINARSERKVPGLILAEDLGRGKNVTGRARMHPLIDLVSSLALKGGDLGFRIVQKENNLEFQVYQPTDKTKTVVFSPLLGNLIDFDYSSEDAEANYVIVGGGGEGAERTFVERGDSTSITKYGRIESFKDRRDTVDTTELNGSLDEELLAKAEKTSLSISPIDMEGITFGKDYNLGDKVSVVITQPNEVVDIETVYYFLSEFQSVPIEQERIRKIQEKIDVIQDVVREVKISITPERETITPNIGTPESLSKAVPGIFDEVKKLRRRISNLERR